jgi:hypothetical protein
LIPTGLHEKTAESGPPLQGSKLDGTLLIVALPPAVECLIPI